MLEAVKKKRPSKVDQEMENKNKSSFLRDVISKYPWESVLELIVFDILINNLEKMPSHAK